MIHVSYIIVDRGFKLFLISPFFRIFIFHNKKKIVSLKSSQTTHPTVNPPIIHITSSICEYEYKKESNEKKS